MINYPSNSPRMVGTFRPPPPGKPGRAVAFGGLAARGAAIGVRIPIPQLPRVPVWLLGLLTGLVAGKVVHRKWLAQSLPELAASRRRAKWEAYAPVARPHEFNPVGVTDGTNIVSTLPWTLCYTCPDFKRGDSLIHSGFANCGAPSCLEAQAGDETHHFGHFESEDVLMIQGLQFTHMFGGSTRYRTGHRWTRPDRPHPMYPQPHNEVRLLRPTVLWTGFNPQSVPIHQITAIPWPVPRRAIPALPAYRVDVVEGMSSERGPVGLYQILPLMAYELGIRQREAKALADAATEVQAPPGGKERRRMQVVADGKIGDINLTQSIALAQSIVKEAKLITTPHRGSVVAR